MTLLGCEPGCAPRRRWIGRVLAMAAVALAATTAAGRASAYCRTTTCPTCPKDDNGCPTGIPLVWQTSCVSYAMHYRASKQIDLATATDVMEKAFAV